MMDELTVFKSVLTKDDVAKLAAYYQHEVK